MSSVLREPRELFAEKVPQNRPHASFTKTCKVQQKTAKLVSLKHWLFLLSVSLTSFSSFCYRGVVGICHCGLRSAILSELDPSPEFYNSQSSLRIQPSPRWDEGKMMVIRKSAFPQGAREKRNCHCERSVAIPLY